MSVTTFVRLNMAHQLDLLTAVRAGRLYDVRAALDAGMTLDDEGEPGLVMGLACFFGHLAVVRELVNRGAPVDLADNRLPTSPLSMAIRGGRKEVVRLLIELGASVPEGMATGLAEQEVTLARWIACRDGYAGTAPEPSGTMPAAIVEEIEFCRPSNVDTQILEAEALRAVLGK